jgi:hypothetical protein
MPAYTHISASLSNLGHPPLQAPSTKKTPALQTVTGNFTAGLKLPAASLAVQVTSTVSTGNTAVTPGL